MTDDRELNTVVVEFTCPSEQAHEPDNPVDRLIEVFSKAKLRFVVEEYRISRGPIRAGRNGGSLTKVTSPPK